MDYQAMACEALKVEYDAIPHWSEYKDRIARAAWNAGCAWVEPPQNSPTVSNWGASQRQPPRSYTTPGNPADRQPPEW